VDNQGPVDKQPRSALLITGQVGMCGTGHGQPPRQRGTPGPVEPGTSTPQPPCRSLLLNHGYLLRGANRAAGVDQHSVGDRLRQSQVALAIPGTGAALPATRGSPLATEDVQGQALRRRRGKRTSPPKSTRLTTPRCSEPVFKPRVPAARRPPGGSPRCPRHRYRTGIGSSSALRSIPVDHRWRRKRFKDRLSEPRRHPVPQALPAVSAPSRGD
jgi:hypothetical protein